jgi:putative flippase GtrA
MKRSDFRMTRHNIVQFLEYMVGGTVYFWSGYLVFALCYSGFDWDWLPAKMAADAVGWSLNYLVQRYWAFNAPGLRHHEGRTVGKYGVLTIGNFILDYCLIWWLNAIGISPYIGFFISSGFFTIWNYFWYRFWVFYVRKRNTSAESV